MRATARPTRTRPTTRWTAGERVENRQGQAGVVISRHSRTQCVVSYDNRTDVVMYDSSLTITQK